MIRALLRRVWNAFAWLPALADRPGLRWLLSGRVVGAPIVVLTHRGRRSGEVYRTPVEAISEDPVRHEVVVSPMRGRRGDWYRNIVAGGLEQASLRGESFVPAWRELSEPERADALRRYRDDHPLYGRIVLRALARLHHLEGDPLPAVAAAVPMLALRRPSPSLEPVRDASVPRHVSRARVDSYRTGSGGWSILTAIIEVKTDHVVPTSSTPSRRLRVIRTPRRFLNA